ncbi:MAG: patatin-like phospholipase family protein [Verrucomicrobiota bacterium]|jgi:predicted acylesterase/phospholipase RssA
MTELDHIPAGAQPAGDSGPIRSLILAGGGMRVAYQAGVIRALIESGLSFVHADGTSGGTINLAMLFSGLSPVEMCNRWRTLDVHNLASLMPLEQYLKASDLMGMGSADGIINKVFPHLGVDISRINAAQGMQGTFNVCNYSRKISEVITHDRIDLDMLVAGISLPILMPPVRKGSDLYVDSVWIRDANLMEAVRQGAEELWVVWCIGNIGIYKGGAFNQYVHMIEISANGALFGEFDRINEINNRILKGETVLGHTRPIKLHLIRPEYPLPLDPDYFLGRIDGATLIAMGYADASKYLVNKKPEGLPLQPETTQMQNPTLGITFRETMAGGFTLGETDPEAGSEKGKNSGSILAMHSTITIQDLNRFISDPDHAGQIEGSIDYAAFGENIPASTGVFNLFSPTDQPGLKLMVYEMGFTANGQNYYLAGKKEVRDDSVVHMWKETTTLYAQLHEGTDKTGPVVGAGILTLGPLDLMKMVSTMHALNASSPTEGAKAMMTFGEFFLGKLWDSYVKRT